MKSEGKKLQRDEKKILVRKKKSLSQRSKTLSLVRSHDLLKTDLPSPLVLGEYHTGVCLPG